MFGCDVCSAAPRDASAAARVACVHMQHVEVIAKPTYPHGEMRAQLQHGMRRSYAEREHDSDELFSQAGITCRPSPDTSLRCQPKIHLSSLSCGQRGHTRWLGHCRCC